MKLVRSMWDAGAGDVGFGSDFAAAQVYGGVRNGRIRRGPGFILAALKRIPVVIFEPNAAPGFANRVLARFRDAHRNWI